MTDPELQQKRLLAAAIDCGILLVAGMLMGVLLGLVGVTVSLSEMGGYGMELGSFAVSAMLLLYVLGRDMLAGERSFGKKLMEIRLVTVAGAPVGIVESVKRNALFAPPFALWCLSALLGLLPLGNCVACLLLPLQLLAALGALVITVWELVQIAQEPDGIRMGDKIAGTRVVV